MKSTISFQERSRLGMEDFSKQPLTTLEKARQKVEWLNSVSASNKKMQELSFQERAKLGMAVLSKQELITLEKAQAQIKRIHAARNPENMKSPKIDKKLTKEQVKEVQILVEKALERNPTYIKGQLFFNALLELHPEIANSITGTSIDPFYDDGLIEKCITEISI